MNVNVPGGHTVNNCYVRVDSVRAFKKDDMSGWKLMVDTYVYKNKTERNKGSLGCKRIILRFSPRALASRGKLKKFNET